MFFETISRENFAAFLKSRTDFSLSGTIMDKSESKHFYRFVRMPLADDEHHVEALYGKMYCSYPAGVGDSLFSRSEDLEFMAFVVDYEDAYCMNYMFLSSRLFGLPAIGSPRDIRNDMAQDLMKHLQEKTVIEPELLNDPALQAVAYEKAVEEYVMQQKIANPTREKMQEFMSDLDDTTIIEYLASPTKWADRVIHALDEKAPRRYDKPFSQGAGKRFLAIQHLTEQKINAFQADPCCWESACRGLFTAIKDMKNVRLTVEMNGNKKELLYPAHGIIKMATIRNKSISTFAIYPSKLTREMEDFLEANSPEYADHRYEMPMSAISCIKRGKKTLWENPMFKKG